MGFTSLGTYFYKAKKIQTIDWTDLFTYRESQVQYSQKKNFEVKLIFV
jgi:hypothetical protein